MAKRVTVIVFGLFAAFSLFGQNKPNGPIQASVQVHFSPGGKPTNALVEALNNAKSTVLVQAYSFTSAPIAAALREAHRRGVSVKVILDKSQRTERYSSATFIQNAGIPVWIDAKHAIAHNKVIIIDSTIVVTGSFNFS